VIDIRIVHYCDGREETWLAILGDNVVGRISMELELGDRIKFKSAWVSEECRRKGIFRKLWDLRWERVSSEYSGWTCYAWCLEKSLPLLLEKGFVEKDFCVLVEKQVE